MQLKINESGWIEFEGSLTDLRYYDKVKIITDEMIPNKAIVAMKDDGSLIVLSERNFNLGFCDCCGDNEDHVITRWKVLSFD